jgi:iron(III) transport system permease protein
MRKMKLEHHALAILLYGFFAIFLIWPIWQVVSSGFVRRGHGFTLEYVRLIFTDPVLVTGLIHAMTVAVAVTTLSLAISLPLAILSVRYEFPGGRFLSGLLLAPLVLPPFVGAIGMRLILGRLGPLSVLLGMGHGRGFDWIGKSPLAGVILVETLHLYPVLLLNIQAALANLDPSMEQAAANLGAGRLAIFRRITLPLLRPGIFAGCTLTLIWSFTELGTPLMFDYLTITPVQIFSQITDIAANPLPFALVVVTLVISAMLYAIGKGILGRSDTASTMKAATAIERKPLRGIAGIFAAAFFAGILFLAILPHIAVILLSVTATGQWYRSILPQQITASHYSAALASDLAIPSVLNSIEYAVAATLVALLIGLIAALLIERSRLKSRRLIDALATLPLAVPGLVLAFGYLAISVWLKQIWAKHPRFGAMPIWLDVQENPLVFLVIAYAVRRLPYVVRAAASGLQQTPVELELAAENLGASKWRVLRKITAPLILANLIAGALLTFSFSLLEVSDSLILAQKQSYFPITRAIYELAQRLGDGMYIAAALGVWAMLLLALALLAAHSAMGKRLGSMFRT